MTPPKAGESSDSIKHISSFDLGPLWLLIAVLMVVLVTLASVNGWVTQPPPNGDRPTATSQPQG